MTTFETRHDPLALRDHRRLFLRDHVVRMHIGAHDHERGQPQRVVFNVDLWVPLAASTPRADRLDEVVDYDFIRRTIGAQTAGRHIDLQETVADAVLRALLAHPLVAAARVSTMKVDVYPDCAGVGVEVMAVRDAA